MCVFNMYTHTCVQSHMHTHTRTLTHTYHVHTHRSAHSHMWILTPSHSHKCALMHRLTHTGVHSHTCTHTQIHSHLSVSHSIKSIKLGQQEAEVCPLLLLYSIFPLVKWGGARWSSHSLLLFQVYSYRIFLPPSPSMHFRTWVGSRVGWEWEGGEGAVGGFCFWPWTVCRVWATQGFPSACPALPTGKILSIF